MVDCWFSVTLRNQDLLDIEDNPVHVGNEIGSLADSEKF